MESDTRRLVVAMMVAMVLFVGYQIVINKIFPPRKPTSAPATTQPVQQPPEPVAAGPASQTTTTGEVLPPPVTTSSAPGRMYALIAGEDTEPITLGGRDDDALRLELNPLGAALATLDFTARDKEGHLVHKIEQDVDEPYRLLSPVHDGPREHFSFATHRVWVGEHESQTWRLDDLPWVVAETSADKVVFTATIGSGRQGDELLRLTKTYALRVGKPVFDIDLLIENTGTAPITLRVEQDGPTGVRRENPRWDMRRLLAAQFTESGIELSKGHRHKDLLKATQDPSTGHVQLVRPDQGPFLWCMLANKYFGVYTRPLPTQGRFQDYVVGASGLVAAPDAIGRPNDPTAEGDMLVRLATRPTPLKPGGEVSYAFEVYAGPKDAGHLAAVDPDYADKTKLYYQLAQSADQRCCCTFLWLQDIMVWMLEHIYKVVRNYGIAILILVVIVRGLLHKLTVWQQKSMFRMQDSMGRLQPRMQEIKEKYANDKVKQNQEMMKLWGEEGVNPMSQFVSFLPMFLQMPILVALWTALNTDVNLRHAPFDGWWMTDLSAPDAFFTFDPPIDIPVLSWLPLVGSWFKGVESLNLLPILMGVSMWLQQKYMPKPHMKAKLEAAQKQPAPTKGKGGLSPQDQLRQQQMMAYMMAILFPLMFYKMPSGLTLYWFFTNIFGIAESLLIRRQLDEEKKRRELEGPRPPKKKGGGLMSRFFRHIASQAEELQRKADTMSQTGRGRGKKKS